MTIIKDTDPTTLAICENCGKPASYDSDLILCDKCNNEEASAKSTLTTLMVLGAAISDEGSTL